MLLNFNIDKREQNHNQSRKIMKLLSSTRTFRKNLDSTGKLLFISIIV